MDLTDLVKEFVECIEITEDKRLLDKYQKILDILNQMEVKNG